MKFYFLLFFHLLFFTTAISQHVAVSNDKMNIAYLGVDNPISIAVGNINNHTLKISTSNGTITCGRDGKYILRPSEAGVARITIITSKNKIYSWAFSIRKIPLPGFKIGSGKDSVSKNELVNQQYVRADFENFGFDIKVRVDSFNVHLFSADTCKTFAIKNTGNIISDKTRSLFESVKSGDWLLFDNIYATGPDAISIRLEPRIIKIK